MKITKSGKTCVHWNKIPYLSNTSFPILEKDYCRNPEGYGFQPWCYVDIKNRTWEYCEIEACEGEFFISFIEFNSFLHFYFQFQLPSTKYIDITSYVI